MSDTKSDTKKTPQRYLTPSELEQAAGFTQKWQPSQIQLIWRKKMPADANLEDLQLFLYACETRDLDPLLGEIHCRLQWEREAGELKLLILDGIHGMFKSADKTGQLNGIKTTFTEDADMGLVSATTLVYRKGCEHPFEATAYWAEYNAGTFIWKSKPRVMLSKCSQALCLRMAFAAALGGVYLEEEFHLSDSQPEAASEPRPTAEALPDEFTVVATDTPEVESKVAETMVMNPAVNGTIHPIVAEIVPAEDHPPIQEPEAALFYTGGTPVEHTKEEKQKQKQANRALLQRLLTDLQVPTGERARLTNEYCVGYLDEPLPSDPFGFIEPLAVLDQWALHNPSEARSQFLSNPRALGHKMRSKLLLAKEA